LETNVVIVQAVDVEVGHKVHADVGEIVEAERMPWVEGSGIYL